MLLFGEGEEIAEHEGANFAIALLQRRMALLWLTSPNVDRSSPHWTRWKGHSPKNARLNQSRRRGRILGPRTLISFASAMPRMSRFPYALPLSLMLSTLAQSEEAGTKSVSSFDTEHIFGFAEGSDIGKQGELEIEGVTIGSFGAARGSHSNIDNETSFRYGVTNELRLSIGSLTDYFNIHNVPGLKDRSAAEFSGIITEIRWHILDWRTSPFGMTLSLNPFWRRADPTSGRNSGNYAFPLTLLADKEVIPEKFFTVLNLIYHPSFLRPNGRFEHDDSFIVIAGGSYAITPNILLGAEIRHENLAHNGNLFAHALYAGPQLFVALGGKLDVKVAWAEQIPDFAANRLDLTNYPRHQVEVQFAYTF